jgi:V/A-type H+-transporting ATPase subunit D
MTIESIACTAARDVSVDIIEKRIWGLRYRDILLKQTLVREPDERGYDIRSTNPHIEESIYFFEKVLESMVELAAYESKLKRLGDEITRISRKVKVLEERVLPRLKRQIQIISQYIGEREREVYYRLKKFKEITLREQESAS